MRGGVFRGPRVGPAPGGGPAGPSPTAAGAELAGRRGHAARGPVLPPRRRLYITGTADTAGAQEAGSARRLTMAAAATRHLAAARPEPFIRRAGGGRGDPGPAARPPAPPRPARPGGHGGGLAAGRLRGAPGARTAADRPVPPARLFVSGGLRGAAAPQLPHFPAPVAAPHQLQSPRKTGTGDTTSLRGAGRAPEAAAAPAAPFVLAAPAPPAWSPRPSAQPRAVGRERDPGAGAGPRPGPPGPDSGPRTRDRGPGTRT